MKITIPPLFAFFAIGFITLVGNSQFLWSSNFHEHYSSLASYDDYKFAFQQITNQNPAIKDLDHTLLGSTKNLPGLMENCSDVFKYVYGIAIAQAECEKFTLDAAAKCVSDARKENRPESLMDVPYINSLKRGFFEFNEYNEHNPMSMEMIGWNVRTNTQKLLTELTTTDGRSGIYYLFKHYLAQRPLEDRKVIALSIGASAYKGDANRKVLIDLRDLLKSYDTRPEFFLVWQRNKMIQDARNNSMGDFESVLEQLDRKANGDIRTALDLGLIDGFDLVGSLHEDHERQTKFKISGETPTQTEVRNIKSGVRSQMRRMFEVLERNPQLQLKLHAWEKPYAQPLEEDNHYSGRFYKALRETLAIRTSDEGRVIRIGHIGGINPARDVPYFKHLSDSTKTKIIFEANIRSSIGNHEVSMRELIQILHALSSANFDIVLGTDGAGILVDPDPHYTATMAVLKQSGLDKITLARIREATRKYSVGDYAY